MKAVNTGNVFRIYGNHLKVYDNLPAGSYIIRFQEMQGFFLESYSDIKIHEEKIYGVHLRKVDKCLNAFKKSSRSLGVILSGTKGIGKSLFAKLLSKTAVEQGYALIVVDQYIPGIASFIEEIEQEVIVLFDEFDKTFCSRKKQENNIDPQTEMLTLFDGISVGKKLYIVTCNELFGLNEHMVNRPGRFHYHLRFDYPEGDEIKEYLQDKLDERYWAEIHKVVAFSRKIDLNYDCLRAIAFEIQNGETFEDAIKDLNIVNTETSSYKITVFFKDGTSMIRRRYEMNMFGAKDDTETVWLRDSIGHEPLCVEFCTADAVYNVDKACSIIQGEKIKISSIDKDDCDDPEAIKALVPDFMTINRATMHDIHYAI